MKWAADIFRIALVAMALTLSSSGQAAAADAKPNILFILLDNVGWGDLGVYGGMTPTPRIDKLASEGIRFNSYYVDELLISSRGFFG